ncbi:protein kinase [Streptomyces sp. NBC_01433]|uniref:protein kinase n=1 Tax=Streptomyces sp. NBC_01433 TaxID=2903864 RepID=UPI00224DF06B|nr:protein kinase [Streptomyces sp. NBC_01433]MCX4674823.1 protein kinase [Streptomyces sp. NBC_01433]
MDDYAGRVLADRYRLPLPPFDGYELVETRAFDTYSGQEVLIRQVPLPEIVEAEVLDADGLPAAAGRVPGRTTGRAVRRPTDPAVRRAIEAAQAAAQVPDHPRLDQVFDVFAEAGSLWIVSELVAARTLAALLAERPLNPYRAAEIGSDVLAALRVLHAHDWTHRNITVRTVLICDDGRVVLTGLAAGAAEEALCGYVTAPLPDDDDDVDAVHDDDAAHGAGDGYDGGDGDDGHGDDGYGGDGRGSESPYGTEGTHTTYNTYGADVAPAAAHDAYADPSPMPPDSQELVPRPAAPAVPYAGARPLPEPGAVQPGAASAAQLRAARAGAIAAYRAGARAAARGNVEDQHHTGNDTESASGGAPDAEDTALLPVQRPAPRDSLLPGAWSGAADDPYAGDDPYTEDDPYAADDPYTKRDERDDEHDEDGRGEGDGGDRPPGRRVHLAGSWDDGPGSGRPVPAGGSGEDALRADSRRPGNTPVPAGRAARPAAVTASGGWDEVVAGGRGTPAYRGPATPLAAERARQARIAVVGAVTERWAPEQAGPVHENWQLAPPIGPATDLWALGALLYRAVQGHAPYPEENAAELVQMVCGEPPAFAEECGALRPVVESLLRQDPTERPDVEELSGWLRSLVRSAPEPEAGTDVVPLPSADETRLPVVRRKGELVRRRRGRRLGGGSAHGRHRQGKQKPHLEKPRREPAGLPEEPRESAESWETPPSRPPRAPRAPREPKGPKVLREPARQREGKAPRSLGRMLLVLILLGMAAAVAYALIFMSEDDPGTGTAPSGSATPAGPGAPEPSGGASGTPGSQQPQTSRSAVALARGYVLRKDTEGFEVGVLKGWQRSPANADRQIRYGSDGFSLLIVPGRDTVKANGADPLAYQRDKEPELQPFRDSSWSSAVGLRRVDVGRQAMAEGQFTWQDGNGREVYVRNLVMVVDGKYHIIQALGPQGDRDKVTAIYEQAIASYRVGS